MEASSNESMIACDICKEDFLSNRRKKIGTIPCGHCYHINCLKTWFRTQHNQHSQTNCPKCRTPADFEQVIRLFLFDSDSNDAADSSSDESSYSTSGSARNPIEMQADPNPSSSVSNSDFLAQIFDNASHNDDAWHVDPSLAEIDYIDDESENDDRDDDFDLNDSDFIDYDNDYDDNDDFDDDIDDTHDFNPIFGSSLRTMSAPQSYLPPVQALANGRTDFERHQRALEQHEIRMAELDHALMEMDGRVNALLSNVAQQEQTMRSMVESSHSMQRFNSHQFF